MLYTNARIEVDNTLLLQATSIEVTRANNAIEQHTMALGFSGMSPGSPMMNVTVDNGIPSAGIEYDAGAALVALREVAVTLYLDSQTITTIGFITQDVVKKGTDQNASYSFQLKCKLTPNQARFLAI